MENSKESENFCSEGVALLPFPAAPAPQAYSEGEGCPEKHNNNNSGSQKEGKNNKEKITMVVDHNVVPSTKFRDLEGINFSNGIDTKPAVKTNGTPQELENDVLLNREINPDKDKGTTPGFGTRYIGIILAIICSALIAWIVMLEKMLSRYDLLSGSLWRFLGSFLLTAGPHSCCTTGL